MNLNKKETELGTLSIGRNCMSVWSHHSGVSECQEQLRAQRASGNPVNKGNPLRDTKAGVLYNVTSPFDPEMRIFFPSFCLKQPVLP